MFVKDCCSLFNSYSGSCSCLILGEAFLLLKIPKFVKQSNVSFCSLFSKHSPKYNHLYTERILSWIQPFWLSHCVMANHFQLQLYILLTFWFDWWIDRYPTVFSGEGSSGPFLCQVLFGRSEGALAGLEAVGAAAPQAVAGAVRAGNGSGHDPTPTPAAAAPSPWGVGCGVEGVAGRRIGHGALSWLQMKCNISLNWAPDLNT